MPNKGYFGAAILILSVINTCAQKDVELLSSIEKQLDEKKVTISSVLADPNYQSLHPLTGFRELAKKYATSSVRMVSDKEPGTKILIKGTLVNTDNSPVAGTVIYLYQTDARGWYAADNPHVGGNSGDRGHARIFGYVKTDAKGNFEIQTVKPAGYPESEFPGHIHFELKHNNRTVISELLFDDDPRLIGEIRASSIRNGFIIAKPETAKGFDQQFVYRITI